MGLDELETKLRELEAENARMKAAGKALYNRTKDKSDPCRGDCWMDSRCPFDQVCNE